MVTGGLLGLGHVDGLAHGHKVAVLLFVLLESVLHCLVVLQHFEVPLPFFVEVGLGGVESAFQVVDFVAGEVDLLLQSVLIGCVILEHLVVEGPLCPLIVVAVNL